MDQEISNCDRLWTNARLVTLDPATGAGYAMLEHYALGVSDGLIAVIAPMEGLDLSGFDKEVTDCRGALITPGFIDCHTHLVYGGNRAGDFVKRLQGMSYEQISRTGGGIRSTMQATRASSEEELFLKARPRLLSLIAEGCTMVEIKSGYGLNVYDELKMLRVVQRLREEHPVRISATLLAAHAVPPEYLGKSDAYVDLICTELIPRVSIQKLADAVDVFCEKIAFTAMQAERLFLAARDYGLGLKIHAEQLSDTGAAALAAAYGAWSADHLEQLEEEGVRALQQAGTVATLLPGAYYFLKETRMPPVALFREYRVPMALSTDLNPGSSPFASIRLIMNLACLLWGLTPEEALAGVTRNAARALGWGDRLGTLTVGKEADFLVWDLEDPAQLPSEVGLSAPLQRVLKGVVTRA
ncbi:imidazolonepropionase [Geomonas sp. RF6]|uniref:imidazolonepropionase n=1 Tax=Geomonas sp. RF6 TaxID=2897342 RepID=UPI001E33FFCD|nr:imidazolonepropionase [Geomonas sp. RF6]UFS70173.1 imidazolonepropionase [Geomonas sp. RF6]